MLRVERTPAVQSAEKGHDGDNPGVVNAARRRLSEHQYDPFLDGIFFHCAGYFHLRGENNLQGEIGGVRKFNSQLSTLNF
jgi:hypothetical protein